jgi:hypothetical protein
VGEEEEFGVEREAIQAGPTEQLQRSLAAEALQAALRIAKRQAQERLDDTVEQQACQPADKRARDQGGVPRADGHRGGSERGHNPVYVSGPVGPVGIGKHHQFTPGCQNARAHAKPLAAIGPAMDHSHARIPGGDGAAHGQGFVGGPVVYDQNLDLALPLRQLGKESGQRVGEALSLVETRENQGQPWPGGYAGIRAGLPWSGQQPPASVDVGHSSTSRNPRPRLRLLSAEARVVRRSHHPCLGSGDNAYRGIRVTGGG